MSFKILAATLLLALPAAGADPLLPQLRIEPIAGGSILYVRNVSSQPLTGYAIELVNYPGSFFALWQDELTSEAIAPDKEKRIQVANMTVGAAQDYVKIQAAVYADGTTAGVPEKVAQFIDRRRFSLETVRDLIHRVELAQAQNVPKETAAASLKRSAEFMLLPPGADKASQVSINQFAGRTLFFETAGYMDGHSLDETLARLHAWEKAFVGSKPAL
jgi:hypothetical protein